MLREGPELPLPLGSDAHAGMKSCIEQETALLVQRISAGAVRCRQAAASVLGMQI